MYNLTTTILELMCAYNCSEGYDTPNLINQAKEVKLAWLNKTKKTQQEYNTMFELIRILPHDSQIKAVLATA